MELGALCLPGTGERLILEEAVLGMVGNAAPRNRMESLGCRRLSDP